jgi:hypothetical protein
MRLEVIDTSLPGNAGRVLPQKKGELALESYGLSALCNPTTTAAAMVDVNSHNPPPVSV